MSGFGERQLQMVPAISDQIGYLAVANLVGLDRYLRELAVQAPPLVHEKLEDEGQHQNDGSQ